MKRTYGTSQYSKRISYSQSGINSHGNIEFLFHHSDNHIKIGLERFREKYPDYNIDEMFIGSKK